MEFFGRTQEACAGTQEKELYLNAGNDRVRGICPCPFFKMNPAEDFELKEDDNAIVRAFKESKTYMWFREPITDPDAMINNLPLEEDEYG